MAFPQVASITPSSFFDGLDHAVAMPAVVDAGDLLVTWFCNQRSNNTVTTPSGWTQLFSVPEGLESAGVRYGAYYKIADGTEGGTTVTFTIQTFLQACAQVYRITNWHGTTPPEVGTAATGTTGEPDPPSLTPSWGGLDTLWIAGFGGDLKGTVSGFPANYTDGLKTGSADSGGGTVDSATARRELNATSDNPGEFTWSSIPQEWVANPLAVRPGGETPVSQTAESDYEGLEGLSPSEQKAFESLVGVRREL